jgi:endonuclease G
MPSIVARLFLAFIRPISGIVIAIGLVGTAFAQPSTASPSVGLSPPAHCDDFFQGAQQPVLLASPARPTRTGKTICHSFYAVSYSTELRDPLWSAEHLTKDMAVGGDNISRTDQGFVKDGAVAADDQASDSDFVAPNDRGHMTPANDAPDETTQRDTFVFTNAVPQDKNLNRYLWQYLEASLHQVAEVEGDVYIVTGPIFGSAPHLEHGRVAKPNATFKAIYIPSHALAVGYVATNNSAATCRIFPVAEIIRRSGIDPFPALSTDVKAGGSTFGLPAGVNVKRNGSRQHLPLPACH